MGEVIQPERRVGSRQIYNGKIVQLHVDEVELPNGNRATREVVEHSDAVVIVPIDAKGNVLLVRQYRYPIANDLLEAPAGGMDGDEEPHEAAQRELQEEIGFASERLEYLGKFWSAPGFCTELMHAFVARNLVPSQLPPDDDESIIVERYPLDSVRSMIRDGLIVDAKTIAAYWMAVDQAN